MIKDELMRRIPKRYQEDPVMNNIMESDDSELERLFEHISDLARQRFVVTATWGLYEWEKLVGIPHGNDLIVEQRRARVLAKLMMINTMTHFRMDMIVKNFIESSYVVELISEYALKVVITEWELAIKALYEAIEEAKPAHLGLIIEFRLENELYFGLYAKNCGEAKIRPTGPAGKEESNIYIGRYTKEGFEVKARSNLPEGQIDTSIFMGRYVIENKTDNIRPKTLSGKITGSIIHNFCTLQYESLKIL